ncbi:MAG: hypothetical protein U9N87_08345 [Planctomycetota bacterium]|nr:hypothetical protein [Planctomycetota bacterium]
MSLMVIVAALAYCSVAVAADKAEAAKKPLKSEFFRQPVKGVMPAVEPARQTEESVSRHDVVELLAVDPSFNWAKEVPFRTPVWNLQFKYKPVRMVWVDVPQKSGKMLRKPIYYMVYSVTNLPRAKQKNKPPQFGWMVPVKDEDGTYKVEYEDRPIRFIPRFLLESPEFSKIYADRIIPLALGAIRAREDRLIPDWVDKKGEVPRSSIQTTVDIAGELKVGETRWGVATWEDLDPRIDRFSIYVHGLTNAYKWSDAKGVYKKGDTIGTGRRLSRKTLKLNFWRPGDEFYEREDEIRRGIPSEVDYEWVYQ